MLMQTDILTSLELCLLCAAVVINKHILFYNPPGKQQWKNYLALISIILQLFVRRGEHATLIPYRQHYSPRRRELTLSPCISARIAGISRIVM